MIEKFVEREPNIDKIGLSHQDLFGILKKVFELDELWLRNNYFSLNFVL